MGNKIKNESEPVLVLFDRGCPLCRAIASLLANDLPEGWRLENFQDYQKLQPDYAWQLDELHVLAGDKLLSGIEAWDLIIQKLPQMKAYSALASKIGLSSTQKARLLRFFGHGLRSLCPICPHRRHFYSRRARESD
jgi:hypothetical protein